MPGYIQMEACYSNRLSAGNVGWLIIDEDDFVGSKRQRFQRQCIRARVRLENFCTSGVDDGIHLVELAARNSGFDRAGARNHDARQRCCCSEMGCAGMRWATRRNTVWALSRKRRLAAEAPAFLIWGFNIIGTPEIAFEA